MRDTPSLVSKRALLPLVAAAAYLLAAACGRSPTSHRLSDDEHRRASRVYGKVEVRPLAESLEAIESWLRERLRPTAETLHRGRRRNEIVTRLERLGLSAPKELFALYAWRDGQRGVPEGELFPGFRFLSLADAVEEYARVGQQVADGEVPEAWWSKSYFPILKAGSDLIVVVCGGEESGTVLEWSGTSGRTVGYPSLASLMQEVAENYRTGAFYVADDGSLTRDDEKEAQVFARYHPELPSRFLLASDREVTRKDKKHFWGGSRTVTVTLTTGGRETFRYDDRGLLVSKVVEFDGKEVMTETTEYDAAGRPISRRATGFLAELVAWKYGEDGAVEIRKKTRDGTRVMQAHRDEDGVWSVRSASFER